MSTISEIQNQIIELYIGTFDRAADADGLTYWVSKITSNGWDLADIAKSMFDSAEVAAKYPASQSNADFINALYTNILDRNADAGGLAYWQNQMDNGISRDSMIITLINGAKAASGDPADKALLENKAAVARHFAVDLGLNDLPLSVTSLSGVTALLSSVDNANDALDLSVNLDDSSKIVLQGDAFDNVIAGAAEAEYIYGLAGDDVITTGEGDNVAIGGEGVDSIYAGTGSDTLYGRLGNDTLYADAGDDLLYGNEGDDSLHGGAGNDTIFGNSGDDYIYGDEGDDIIFAGEGADVITGGAGNDTINGGSGNDFINADSGLNFVDGGAGNDILNGGPDVDRIYGGADDDSIYGMAGNDLLDGLSGNDTIYAGDGDDVINGNEGNDLLFGSTGNDVISGEGGNDTIDGGLGTDVMSGGSGNDLFSFQSLTSTLTNLDVITDFSFDVSGADKLALANQGAEVFITQQLDLSGLATLTLCADLAAINDGSVNALLSWFVFDDNTYIVEDLSAAVTFDNSTDILIKLQGILDLSLIDNATVSFV